MTDERRPESGLIFPNQPTSPLLEIGDLYADAVDDYLKEASQFQVLRPHQRDVFGDFGAFLRSRINKGYVTLPTGTGKTVLFVELSKAFLLYGRARGLDPRILVVTPSKDLVHQTLGRTDDPSRKRGYGKFAPELKVGSYFSDSSKEEKKNLDDYDVVVTTFKSFGILSRTQELRSPSLMGEELYETEYFQSLLQRHSPEQARWLITRMQGRLPTGRTLLDKFNVFFIDEAHHAIGGDANYIIRSLPENKIVIGFTATSEANEMRKVENVLPYKIHDLRLNEATALGLTAPVVPMGVRSGIRIRGSNLYDEKGDYIDDKLSYLARSEHRNDLIVEGAKIFAEFGIGTLTSCIAGGEAWHARHLAERISDAGVPTVAVHSEVPSKQRQKIYDSFEAGEIAGLTFVGVLGEGWDSNRAKALIGGRPTRSLVFSTQRLGRITRVGGVAFLLDIWDDSEDKNPAITGPDIFNEGAMALGAMIGEWEDPEYVQAVLDAFKTRLPVLETLDPRYRNYQELLATLDPIVRGKLVTGDRFAQEFALASRINPAFKGVTDDILLKAREMYGLPVRTKEGRQGSAARITYNVGEARNLLYMLPTVDPQRYYIDEDKKKWISTKGLAVLFGKKFAGLYSQVIEKVLDPIEDQLNWVPAKYQLTPSDRDYFQTRRYEVLKMYDTSGDTIPLVEKALTEYFV